MIDDAKFFAWLDGELGADEAAAVEHAVTGDPRLSALADEDRAMRARIKGTFNQVSDAPVPENLDVALRNQQAEVIDFISARQRQRGPDQRALPQWMKMAAMLGIGVFVGTLANLRSGSPIDVENGRIYAASGLAEALDTQLAVAPASNSPVRIGLTFRDQAGAICRSFSDTQASGLACRQGSGWQVRGLFSAPEGQSNEYRMAAGMDPNLAALVDSTMAGEPFEAAQEEASRKAGWK